MEKKSRGLTIASIVFLWIDILYLIGLTLFVIFVIKRISPVYYDLGDNSPIITRIISSGHYIFPILASILIIKEKISYSFS